MRKRFILITAGVSVLCALAWAIWSAIPPAKQSGDPPELAGDAEVDYQIAILRAPPNKVQYIATLIPGGELLAFSPPMKELIRLGDRARPALNRCLGDEAIQNEVVLVLGAIGDRETVRLLIEAYPAEDVRDLARDDPRWVRAMCFSFALPYLTGQQIGRDRGGADFDPQNRALWRQWWEEHGGAFSVPAAKPNASWVPNYPGA
jgi:hypothetical protein